MQDLTPVGLSNDGRKLILISSSGEEFAVSVDSRLRAAMRGDDTRFAQLEMKMESALRPRDIQARIRGGETPEQVATAAQTTVEAIMPFAQPVLDERAHVASGARNASVRRRGTGHSTAAGTLGDSAEIYFLNHGLHDEDVHWDAWRRPDNVWVLVATYAISGKERRAEFTHDLRGRYVVAENDEARHLTGELQPAAPRNAEPASRRPLSAVPPAEELPLGDDAIAMVDERADEPADESSFEQEAWDPAAPVKRQPPSTPPVDVETEEAIGDHADADWIATPPRQHDDADHESQRDEPAAQQESEDDVEDTTPLERRPKKRGRASVPSWDEIMFGGGKKD